MVDERPGITIPSGDVDLAAHSCGSESSTPVVLLHGGGQTRHSWNTTAKHLGRTGWYALTVDLRGHGDSGWSPDGVYDLDRFAGDVKAIADFLQRPPVIVGASLGGISALAALGHHTELALGLVLVDVSPFVQPEGTHRIRDFMTSRPDGFESLEDAAESVAAYLPHRPRPRNLDGLRRNLRQLDGRWYWHWDPAFLRDAVDQPVQRDPLVDPVRLGAASTSLRIPTLLVRGGQSDVLSIADAKHFLGLVLHAEFGNVSGAHHMVAGDDNAVFDRVLDDFLERRIRSRQHLLEGELG